MQQENKSQSSRQQWIVIMNVDMQFMQDGILIETRRYLVFILLIILICDLFELCCRKLKKEVEAARSGQADDRLKDIWEGILRWVCGCLYFLLHVSLNPSFPFLPFSLACPITFSLISPSGPFLGIPPHPLLASLLPPSWHVPHPLLLPDKPLSPSPSCP